MKSPPLEQQAAFSGNTGQHRKCLPAPLALLPLAQLYITLLQQHRHHAYLATCCLLPAVFPHIEGSNPRSLLCAPHFQNASSWSIDHKELSYPAWTLCIPKRRRIHLLSFPLLKVLYSLYPTNFCITVSFVKKRQKVTSVQKLIQNQHIKL